jgi:uncharacterized protein YihD (DUF1040 family)
VANVENLTPFTSEQSREEAVKNGQKGGIASGKARREKKTIQKILAEYLDNDVNSVKSLEKIAKTAGIDGNKSIKELVTAVCILNTLKKGDIDKLSSVMGILGESVEKENTNADVEQTLAVIRECAYAGRDKS